MTIAVYLILIMMSIKNQYKLTHIKIFYWSISIDIYDTCLESTWYQIGMKIIGIIHDITIGPSLVISTLQMHTCT